MMGWQAASARRRPRAQIDLLIVGGGPAGLATAIHAHQLGLTAVVVDGADADGHVAHACSDVLMPAGVRALHELGISATAALGHIIPGARFIDGPVAADYPFAGFGMGVHRVRLMAALWARAHALGVTCLRGQRLLHYILEADQVTATLGDRVLTAHYLIGADGLHSRIRRQAQLSCLRLLKLRYGLRCHLRAVPWTPKLEVHLHADQEAYVFPVGTAEVAINFIGPLAACANLATALKPFPALAARLGPASLRTSVCSSGPLHQPVRRRYAGRVALVGDAAGYLDALTCEGITLSMQCAQALAATVASGRHLRGYEAAYNRITGAYYSDARIFMWLGRKPKLRHMLLRIFAKLPIPLATGIVPRNFSLG